MIIKPKVRGFICTTAHPEGCAANVKEQIEHVKSNGKIENGPKNVLVIGASTGYGLASRITALAACNAKSIGVFYEKASNGKRTATAGWYNAAAFEEEAKQLGVYAKSINGDAFSHDVKDQVIDAIRNEMGGKVDLVVYSLAAPRRIDPDTGEKYSSVLKPIGQAYTNKSIDVVKGIVGEATIEPATDEEVAQTVKVMGGEDWQLWIERLSNEGLLADNFRTVAYSYIGPEITMAMYRDGTIGKAKVHLEETAHKLDEHLSSINGKAYVTVAKALVTQASAAIPIVPLYMAALYKVMKIKGTHEGCIEQIDRMFRNYLYSNDVPLDAEGRIRTDDLEMADETQKEALRLFAEVTTESLQKDLDIEDYQKEFYKLFGFGIDGIDYDRDTEIEVKIASIE